MVANRIAFVCQSGQQQCLYYAINNANMSVLLLFPLLGEVTTFKVQMVKRKGSMFVMGSMLFNIFGYFKVNDA